jgi:glyoxylase-like metal-dependent hydrolase (beta-lactamase superfamily II)
VNRAAGEFVSVRRIGDATIAAINEATDPWAPELMAPEEAWRAALPQADTLGRILIDTHVVYVRLGDASILIDAGLDDPESAWWQARQKQEPGTIRTPGVSAGLAALGVHPRDITHILITHWHYDHIVGLTVEQDGEHVPRYPNARVYIGRGDWEGNAERENPESDVSLRLGAIARHGLLELVDGDREIATGLWMLHTPGESPGHSVVRVESGGERFYALGDLFHVAAEVMHLDWTVPWADPEAMRASRDRVLREAVPAGALLLFTHETFPPWGRIVEENDGYRWIRG